MMDDIDGGDDIGSGELYKSVEEMQNVYDKLLILNYESKYLPISKLPPLHRMYFIYPTNPGEQFYNFASLSSWLIQQCGRSLPIPHETEDPNTVICRILEIVRQMGAILDFSPSRVKSGSGPDVVSVLNFLTDKAVLKFGHEWESPIIPPEKEPEASFDDSEMLITLEKIEEETHYSSSSGEECENDNLKVEVIEPTEINDQRKILLSDTTYEEWEEEMENILPDLKLTIKSNNYDWRWRVSQVQSYGEKLEATIAEIDGPMSRIITETNSVIDAVKTRENNLTNQFSDRLDDVYQSEKQIRKMREKYETLERELRGKNRLLVTTEHLLRDSYRKLEECGQLISNGAPLGEARRTLAALKKEITDMNIQISVLETCIFKKKDESAISITMGGLEMTNTKCK